MAHGVKHKKKKKKPEIILHKRAIAPCERCGCQATWVGSGATIHWDPPDPECKCDCHFAYWFINDRSKLVGMDGLGDS